MDHKAFASQLPPARHAQLTRRSNARGLLHLAGHAGAILGMGAWISAGFALWWALILPQGIALVFLFTLQHECTHKTPFATPWINEWAGRISGAVILQPFEWFRYFHLAHHRYTNIPGKDPELLTGAKPETWRHYLTHVSGLPYWLAMTRQIIRNSMGRDPGDFIPVRARPRVKSEARWMLALYAAAAGSLLFSPVLIWVWILPCLLGKPFLRLYLLAEHGRCALVANMFENTRTTLTNRIVRFLAWNMPYHVEHHTLPNVPFHQLPALHRDMQGHHRVIAHGYGEFTAEYVSDLR